MKILFISAILMASYLEASEVANPSLDCSSFINEAMTFKAKQQYQDEMNCYIKAYESIKNSTPNFAYKLNVCFIAKRLKTLKGIFNVDLTQEAIDIIQVADQIDKETNETKIKF